MTHADRDDLIDAYFSALDEEDLSIVEPYLDDSFVYESSAGVLEGFEGLQRYLGELRTSSNSTHETTQRVHGDAMSVAEGVVSAEGSDGEPFEAKFCDVFEFDPADAAITRIAVYLNTA